MATTFTTATTTNTTTATRTGEMGVDPLYIMAIVFCIIIIVVGVVGNLMVLMVFGGGWLRARSCGVYLINMALANLIGTSIIPAELLLEVMNYGVQFLGDIGCKVVHFLSSVSITVSAFSLVLVTIDRYLVMRSSTRTSTSLCTMIILNILTWVGGAGVAVVYLLGDRIQLYPKPKDRDVSVCRVFWPGKEYMVYVSVVFGLQVVIPLIFMSIMYCIMACHINTRSKSTALLCNEDSDGEEKISEEEVRSDGIAVRILVTVVLVFMTCHLPVNVFYYLTLFEVHGFPSHTELHVYTFLHMLQMASNCLNPVLYFAFIRYLHKLTQTKRDGGEDNRVYVSE